MRVLVACEFCYDGGRKEKQMTKAWSKYDSAVRLVRRERELRERVLLSVAEWHELQQIRSLLRVKRDRLTERA